MREVRDDSREAEDREAERRLRELRGRVERARAVIGSNPGLAETLEVDWQKAARFHARFGTTEELVRHGVAGTGAEGEEFAERVGSRADWMTEMRERGETVAPGADES